MVASRGRAQIDAEANNASRRASVTAGGHPETTGEFSSAGGVIKMTCLQWKPRRNSASFRRPPRQIRGEKATQRSLQKPCGSVLVRLSPSERPISRPSPFAAPERYRTLYRVVCVLYGPEGQGHFMVLPRSRASPRGSLSGGYSPNSYFTSQRSDEASLHNLRYGVSRL